jgi:hypothetical protein
MGPYRNNLRKAGKSAILIVTCVQECNRGPEARQEARGEARPEARQAGRYGKASLRLIRLNANWYEKHGETLKRIKVGDCWISEGNG